MTRHLILGTSGHIDHGKSSLIKALTGTDPDRLPEEKKRGITIELGYAQLDLGEYQLGVVDVPGHERFVRQMLAGATGMDLVLLVIAADDSIKQQTREHLDILRLLDIQMGIIVLTKIDLVEAEWLELVEQEIRDLVAGTFLETAPIARVSSRTGQGIDELRGLILEAANAVVSRDDSGPFRMAIDRSFSIEGFGAVVTGSVNSGTARVGDVVELQPLQVQARIRGIQNHDQMVESVSRGQRAAINLTGVHHQDIQRGTELATLGFLKPTVQLAIELMALPSLKKPIKDRMRVNVHLGTTEMAANLRLPPEIKELPPGERAPCLLFLSQPVVATWGQPVVIRQESPVLTLGGGKVVFPNQLKSARPSELEWDFMKQAASQDPGVRADAAIYLSGIEFWNANDLTRWTGISHSEEQIKALIESKRLIHIPVSKERSLNVHAMRLGEVETQIETVLRRLHESFPLRLGHPLTDIKHRFDYLPDDEVFRIALRHLIDQKKVIATGKMLALEGQGPKLSRGERTLFEELGNQIRLAGLTTPTPNELTASTSKNRESVAGLLKLGVDGGTLIAVAPDWLVHREVWHQTLAQLKQEFDAKGQLTVAEIRTLLNISRKYAVPLCEFLDAAEFTIRDGDYRRLGSKSAEWLDQASLG